MLSLADLKNSPPHGSEFSQRPRKSAGLAWLLSLLLPGAGHLYAGLFLRGALVMGISAVGMATLVSTLASGGSQSSAAGVLVMLLPVLWAFGFLDAYETTVESNRGIDPSLVDNPRVAAVLNLTTRGFGYFYLGERTKGVAVFVAMSVVSLLVGGSTSAIAVAVWLLVTGVTIGIACDAYRAGRRAFDAQVDLMELPPPPAPSRLPSAIPYALAGITALALLALVLGGGLMLLTATPPTAAH